MKERRLVNESKTRIDMKMTGMKLQILAKQNGFSVKYIQKYLGLSCPQPVYRWFKGYILPSVDNLLRLSELFHVHMEDLLVKEHCQNPIVEIVLCIKDDSEFYRRIRAYSTMIVAL